MSKRGENIYKRKDGRWEGRYKSGYKSNGQIKYHSVYASTYSKCKEKLEQMKNKILLGENNINPMNIKVKDIFDVWLLNIEIKVKQSTLNIYQNIVKNHIEPYMYNLSIYNIDLHFINNFIKCKLTNGKIKGNGALSPKTVCNIISVLKSGFKYAEKLFHVKNPINNITIPKTDIKKINVLSNSDLKKIEKYVNKTNDYFKLAYKICIHTGIRLGELCALQWNDFNFKDKILFIGRTIQRVKNTEQNSPIKTKVVISSPKSHNAYRNIPLPDSLISEIKYFYNNRKGNTFVFTFDGIKNIDVRTMQKRFKLVLEKCNINYVKFHTLRHTFATKWAESNFDIKALSEILGHSNVNITLSIYIHSSMNMKRKQINKLYS